jgi:protein-S-isoprenylcysteine O-methyltransferase Ste14
VTTNDKDPGGSEHVVVDPEAAERLGRDVETASAEAPRPARRGSFFARRRTFISLLFPLVLLAFARPIFWWFMGGIAALVVGQMLRLWAAGTIAKDEELSTAGPYGRVRNPLYVGSLLMAVGYCLMSGWWWSFIALAVLFVLFYVTTVLEEEGRLAAKFGQDFREYCNNVPRFRPRLRRWTGAQGGFSLAQAQLNREHVSILWSGILCLAFAARPMLPPIF